MKHLILVGACYLDTILSVPHYPEEDAKLRASTLSIRRGGNCPNTLEVLQQLLSPDDEVRPYLVSCLPHEDSPATRRILDSLGGHAAAESTFAHCIYRRDHTEPASSYIIRSEQTGSRTIVNHNNLPEMTTDEFANVVRAFTNDQETWWHFEGRAPTTTLECIHLLRKTLPSAAISVEIEKPGRDGLPELAAEADVILFSRSWAEDRGHDSPEACLGGEQLKEKSLALCTWGADGAAVSSRPSDDVFRYPSKGSASAIEVVDAIGAGDTFNAGMLYGLLCHDKDWDVRRRLSFAVNLATLKVQQEGFRDLGCAAQAKGLAQ